MTTPPWNLAAPEIAALLRPELPLLPELEAFRANPAALAQRPAMRAVLANLDPLMVTIETIPQTRYTHYRYFIKNGDRKHYEAPYWERRRSAGALALRVFCGETQWKDLLQDYLWAICEETTWVLPAHERRDAIDLFSAETAFTLASIDHLLGRALDPEVRARIRCEVDRRVFQPYLAHYAMFWWYKGGNNWNGVCNSSIASAFLLLEPDVERVGEALARVFAGLDHFLNVAFEPDGTSTEGVGYWHYGLINLVSLSEMLRARSAGALDLLDSDRLRKIAAYPAKLLLSGSMFAAFSDADEITHFNPGIVARLAERTGEASLYDLLATPVTFPGDWRPEMMLRNALWWDGTQKETPALRDAVLTGGGVARLVSPLPGSSSPLIAAIKAGHNAENHNQNDVGSFVVHLDGENLLTDPGRGLYNRDYFGERRYENIFANSFGHSLPRIGGQLQAPGETFRGELLGVQTAGPLKSAVVELAPAYDLPGLSRLTRTLSLNDQGQLWLEDQIAFSAEPQPVEEAFVTWCEVTVEGSSALIRGQRHSLRLTVESPAGAQFAVEALTEQCRANAKEGVLNRLTLSLPAAAQINVRVRMEVVFF